MVGSGSEPWSRSSAFSRDGGNRHQEPHAHGPVARARLGRASRGGPERSSPGRTRGTGDHPPHRGGTIRRLALGGPRVLGSAGSTPTMLCSPIVLFLVVGHGVTVGYHRLLAHKSFVAVRPLKLALTGAGSMAFEGGPIGWVADHRRHHVFSDLEGDPHSPHGAADTAARALARPRGLALRPRADVVGASCEGPHGRPRHGRHECALPDVVRRVARHPLRRRVALGRHAVRRVDGVAVGRRGTRLPHPPRDVEHQLAVSCLWPPSIRHDRSEHERRRTRSLHDGRVVAQRTSRVPRSARHGVLPHQWDTSARTIWWFEQLGWASDVHWAAPAAIARRRSSA